MKPLSKSFLQSIKENQPSIEHLECTALDEHLQNALFYAIKYKANETLEALLRAGCNVNQKNINGDTPLHLAAYFGDVALSTSLINHQGDINAKNKKGITPLMYAANKGAIDLVKLCVQQNASLDARDSQGNSILFYAIGSKKTKIIKYLIALGLSPYAINDKFETLHHEIARNGLKTMSDEIFNYALHADTENIYKQTPLHLAAKAGNEALVQDYLNLGLDPQLKDSFDKTAFQYAEYYGEIKTLMERFIHNLAIESAYKTHTLHRALRFNKIDEAETLLQQSNHINEKDYFGNKPLFYILRSKDPICLKMFLKRSNDFKAIDSFDNDAYFIAALFNNPTFFNSVSVKKDALNKQTLKLIQASETLKKLLADK